VLCVCVLRWDVSLSLGRRCCFASSTSPSALAPGRRCALLAVRPCMSVRCMYVSARLVPCFHPNASPSAAALARHGTSTCMYVRTYVPTCLHVPRRPGARELHSTCTGCHQAAWVGRTPRAATTISEAVNCQRQALGGARPTALSRDSTRHTFPGSLNWNSLRCRPSSRAGKTRTRRRRG